MAKRDQHTDKPFSFNVSDAVEVPLRGYLLRLRLLDGTPSVDQLKPGTPLRLRSPNGPERVVAIRARSMTGGRNEQNRLDRAGLYDIIIDKDDALEEPPIGIGWKAEGPVSA